MFYLFILFFIQNIPKRINYIMKYLDSHLYRLSRGENQKGEIGEIEIYIYIKWKLLISSFYWQKYCHPWVYKFLL